MKKFFSLLLAAVIFSLLTGCGDSEKLEIAENQTDPPHTFAGYPVVYLTTDVSAQGLLSAYEALDPPSTGTLGIKLSETMMDQFTWADLTEALTQTVETSIIENDGAETEFFNYDSTLFLTHFEPHSTVGFYGTVAHLASISSQPEDFVSSADNTDGLMKYLAEQGKIAAEYLDGPVLYIAVLDRWSIGDSSYDRGIAASYDPVSLDQACVDLANMTEECQSLAAHIAACNGVYTLINAEQMGWGSRTYGLLSIDS